jgi:hypothetical protein
MKTDTQTGMIVTPEALGSAGAVSYWRLSGPMTLDALRKEWVAEGLDPELLPKAPSQETALGRAVRELQHKRRLVRPLARRGAWAVVEERVREETLGYRTLVSVKFAAGPQVTQEDASFPEFSELHDAIHANYRRHQGELSGEDISAWLVGLADRNNAVGLRDTGGIYFVPRPAVDFWRRVTRVVHKLSAHKVFNIPAMKNDEAVAAISDAVAQEAERLAHVLESDLAATGDDALGERALRSRAAQCAVTLEKVAAYEALLGVSLDTVRARVEGLKSNVAAAILIAGSEGEAQAA